MQGSLGPVLGGFQSQVRGSRATVEKRMTRRDRLEQGLDTAQLQHAPFTLWSQNNSTLW